MNRASDRERRYVLGHTEREHDRLDLQGVLYRDVTRRALTEGGLQPGMRVLDLGSGSGDVALLAAEIVGPEGQVVGLERDPGTAAGARNRAARRGHANVTFVVGSVDDRMEGPRFDAVVGRFILMHQDDPAGCLRGALQNVREGGVAIFVESCMTLLEQGVHSRPISPLYDRVVRWKCRVVEGAGADLAAGLRLRDTFLAAGLSEPRTHLEAGVEGGPDSLIYRYMRESVASMLPLAEELGVEGFTPADVADLEDALRREVTASGGVLLNWPVVAAWSAVRRS